MEVFPEIPNKNHGDKIFDDEKLVEQNIIDLLNQNHKNVEKEEPSELNSNSTLNSTENTKKKKPFKCDVCNKDFSQKSGLYLHNKRLHQTVGRPFKCDTCDKSYITSIELKSHIKHTHESTKNFFCKVCEVDILYNEKVAHINEYHNEKDGKVKCTKCDKTFATFNLLGKD